MIVPAAPGFLVIDGANMGSEKEDTEPDTDAGVVEVGRPLGNDVDFPSLDCIPEIEICVGAEGLAAGSGEEASNFFTSRTELPAAAGSFGPYPRIELPLDKVEGPWGVAVKSL